MENLILNPDITSSITIPNYLLSIDFKFQIKYQFAPTSPKSHYHAIFATKNFIEIFDIW